jgi:hypothetical protein
VTCYQRHLGWVFEALDVPYDPPHRKQVDSALKDVLGLSSATHCPEVWAAIKALPEGELQSLMPEIGSRIAD